MSVLEDTGTLAFAQAVVRLRGWLDEVASGKVARPTRLEAAARRLVELSEVGPSVFARLAMPARGDDAARVVGASLLALAAGRELTSARAVLLDLVMASLVCGAGVARLRGEAAPAAERAPGLEVASLLGVRSLSPSWIRRIAIAYEAEWLARGDVIGPAYRGARAPTVHARLVAIARRIHGIAAGEGAEELGVELALARLDASFADAADRTVVALVRRALGVAEPQEGRATVLPSQPDGASRVARTPARLEPTARGRLGETPLANILVYALDHGLAGSLELVEADGPTHVITMMKGAPAKVRLADGARRFGDELVRAGVVSAPEVEAAAARAKAAGVLLGEQLLGEGRVSVAAVLAALEAQVRGRIAVLAAKPASTTYAFYKDVDLLAGWGGDGVEVDGLVAAYEAVRAQPDRDRIRATLAKLGDLPLALHPRSWFADVDIGAGRAVVVALLGGGIRVAELLALPTVDPETSASMLYTLAVTRHLALPGQAREPIGSPRRPARPSVPGAAPRAQAERRAPPASSPAPVAPPAARKPLAAPPAAVAAPRPPAVSAKVPAAAAPVVPAVAAPYGAVRPSAVSAPPAEASSPRLPEAPPSGRAVPAASPPAPVARLKPALTERQRQALEDLKAAEVALGRKDLANAEKAARKALQQDPDSVEINALLVWIHVMGGKVRAADAVLQTSQLLERDPSSVRARLYRAKLFKREGKVREAMADFEQVLRAEPDHREAKGELQLLQMTSRFR